jgi:hypothetical protein
MEKVTFKGVANIDLFINGSDTKDSAICFTDKLGAHADIYVKDIKKIAAYYNKGKKGGSVFIETFKSNIEILNVAKIALGKFVGDLTFFNETFWQDYSILDIMYCFIPMENIRSYSLTKREPNDNNSKDLEIVIEYKSPDAVELFTSKNTISKYIDSNNQESIEKAIYFKDTMVEFYNLFPEIWEINGENINNIKEEETMTEVKIDDINNDIKTTEQEEGIYPEYTEDGIMIITDNPFNSESLGIKDVLTMTYITRDNNGEHDKTSVDFECMRPYPLGNVFDKHDNPILSVNKFRLTLDTKMMESIIWDIKESPHTDIIAIDRRDAIYTPDIPTSYSLGSQTVYLNTDHVASYSVREREDTKETFRYDLEIRTNDVNRVVKIPALFQYCIMLKKRMLSEYDMEPSVWDIPDDIKRQVKEDSMNKEEGALAPVRDDKKEETPIVVEKDEAFISQLNLDKYCNGLIGANIVEITAFLNTNTKHYKVTIIDNTRDDSIQVDMSKDKLDQFIADVSCHPDVLLFRVLHRESLFDPGMDMYISYLNLDLIKGYYLDEEEEDNWDPDVEEKVICAEYKNTCGEVRITTLAISDENYELFKSLMKSKGVEETVYEREIEEAEDDDECVSDSTDGEDLADKLTQFITYSGFTHMRFMIEYESIVPNDAKSNRTTMTNTVYTRWYTIDQFHYDKPFVMIHRSNDIDYSWTSLAPFICTKLLIEFKCVDKIETNNNREIWYIDPSAYNNKLMVFTDTCECEDGMYIRNLTLESTRANNFLCRYVTWDTTFGDTITSMCTHKLRDNYLY